MKYLYLILILFLAATANATTYYVDCDADSGGDGTTWAQSSGDGSHAWDSTTDVYNFRNSFATGDDIYFKAGCTFPMTTQVFLPDGASGNRSTVGAYYGNGVIGLGGNARPILDGQWGPIVPYHSTTAIVKQENKSGHITIENLAVTRSRGSGIAVNVTYDFWKDTFLKDNSKLPHEVWINNCHITKMIDEAITLVRCIESTVSNNFVENTTYDEYSETGYRQVRLDRAGIEVTGQSVVGHNDYNVIRNNVVHWAAEGIGLYKGARYCTVRDNIVYDCSKFHIYVGNSSDNNVVRNIVYETGKANQGENERYSPENLLGTDWLIVLDAEDNAEKLEMAGGHNVYGNYLAGGKYGIAILNTNWAAGVVQDNIDIYNNRIVDCEQNIYMSAKQDDFTVHWDALGDIDIHDNYSFIFESGGTHVGTNYTLPTTATWTDNYFNTPVPPGNAGASQISEVITLQGGTTGWRTLTPGAVTPETFAFEGATTCNFVLNPTSKTATYEAASYSVGVTVGSDCEYYAVSNDTWITIDTPGGQSGNSTITYTLTENTGDARVGSIGIGSVTFVVNQSADDTPSCTFSLDRDSDNIASYSSGGIITITASDSGCAWTASESASWLTLNKSSGTGSDTVTYTAAENTGAARSAVITVAGIGFSVNQWATTGGYEPVPFAKPPLRTKVKSGVVGQITSDKEITSISSKIQTGAE